MPGPLREAASALGLPRSLVIRHVAYKAARAGLITGLLLAVARVSGETAPLLFTALNNQFLSTNLNAPMASLPVVIFQFALSPYKDWQSLAWTGALIITMAVLALSITARVLGAQRTPANDQRRCLGRRFDDAARKPARKMSVRNLDFFYGDNKALKIGQRAALRQPGDGLHRAVGLRQIDAAARPQPHVRPLSRPARRRRGAARRREHPGPGQDLNVLRAARRHGVPEADALPDVDLREHRLRRPPLREARPGRDGRAGGEGAARRGDLGRSEGQAAAPAASAFPAASSSACASPAPWRSSRK